MIEILFIILIIFYITMVIGGVSVIITDFKKACKEGLFNRINKNEENK